MAEVKTSIFKDGIVNNPKDPELVPRGGASDALGWITKGTYIELSRGKLLIGAEETANGSVKGHHFGYKTDGTAVQFRKVNTKIQYYSTATSLWVDVITGLTATEQYTFANHSKLSGNFVYASGYDGLYKINVANPASYVVLTSKFKNFEHPGKILISDSRMFMWGLSNDKTGLYVSYIDSSIYTTVTNSLGNANGTISQSATLPTTFSHYNYFGIALVVPTVAAVNISAITKEATAKITTTAAHGLSDGDYVVISGAVGMTEINNRFAKVTVVNSTSFYTDIDSTSFTTYTSGGTINKGEYFKDNYDGTLTGLLGGTGTINYSTAAVTLTVSSASISGKPIAIQYQYEDSDNNGLGDFTYSASRLAGQGNLFRQDDGGDAIQKVEVFNGSYYSLKAHSVYELTLTSDDTNATNLVFRRNIGMPYFRASVSTGRGIVFMDTSDPEYPKLTILERNLTGTGVIPNELAASFDFSTYLWDKCAMEAIGEYIIFSGKTTDSANNNRLFIYSLRWKSIDVLSFNADTFAKDSGYIYIGDSISDNVYQLFTGYDDDGFEIENYFITGSDLLGSEEYKRYKRQTFEGEISKDQEIEVYISLDNDNFTLIGTIKGTGSYVETDQAHTIGSVQLGVDEIGGGGNGTDAYHYFVEFKINTGKFYRRRLKFKATKLGYASITMIKDKDILGYGDRIPRKFRTN